MNKTTPEVRRPQVRPLGNRSRVGSSRPHTSLSLCPHLALEGDAETAALYPRADHICMRPMAPKPSLTWQARFCLAERCTDCRYSSDAPEPRMTDSPGTGRPRGRRHSRYLSGGLFGLLVVLAFSVAIGNVVKGETDVSSGSEPAVPPATMPHRDLAIAVATAEEAQATPVSADVARRDVSEVPPYPTKGQLAMQIASPAARVVVPDATPTPAPLPPPSAAATPAGLPRTHVVVLGETLSDIARTYSTSVPELVRLNHIQNQDLIRPGMVLELP